MSCVFLPSRIFCSMLSSVSSIRSQPSGGRFLLRRTFGIFLNGLRVELCDRVEFLSFLMMFPCQLRQLMIIFEFAGIYSHAALYNNVNIPQKLINLVDIRITTNSINIHYSLRIHSTQMIHSIRYLTN